MRNISCLPLLALLLGFLPLSACQSASQNATLNGSSDAIDAEQVEIEKEETEQVVPGAGVAITNTTVITMEGDRVLENQTVVINGDRIVKIADSSILRLPAGMEMIDGQGKFLIPGFAEMHGHIPDPKGDRQDVENVMFLYVANGVTTVRGMLGAPGQLELKKEINEGSLIGPNLYLAGPSFSGGSISSAEQAREKVRAQKEEGWDLLKVHPGLSLEEYDAMAETAMEVGIPFGGHVPATVGIDRALEAGQISIDHVDGYAIGVEGTSGPMNEDKLVALVAKSKKSGTWIVPTMELWETILGVNPLDEMSAYEEMSYIPARQRNGYINSQQRRTSGANFDLEAATWEAKNRSQILEALHKGGVNIAFGTDAPQLFSVPGFSIHREWDSMLAAGMSNYDILASGTSEVGRYFSDKDDFGTISAGSRADLILLNSNPLEDIHRMKDRAGVMVLGKWLGEEEIQERLKEIASSYKE